jgi:hypothetical protein
MKIRYLFSFCIFPLILLMNFGCLTLSEKVELEDITEVPIPPDQVLITGVVDGKEYSAEVIPSWKDADGNKSNATLTKNSDPPIRYIKGTPISGNGTYTLTVTTTKTMNNLTNVSEVTFTIKEPEKTPPITGVVTEYHKVRKYISIRLTSNRDIKTGYLGVIYKDSPDTGYIATFSIIGISGIDAAAEVLNPNDQIKAGMNVLIEVDKRYLMKYKSVE